MEISDEDDKLFAQYPWGPIVKVKACQSFTGSEVPSCALKRKTDKFILRE